MTGTAVQRLHLALAKFRACLPDDRVEALAEESTGPLPNWPLLEKSECSDESHPADDNHQSPEFTGKLNPDCFHRY